MGLADLINEEEPDRGSTGSEIERITKSEGTIAPVYCKIQLRYYFSKLGAEKCMDYFGYSKKSCWLC